MENTALTAEQYMSMLSDILADRYHTDSPKAFVHTYGCQQNVADSEKIKGMFLQMGCVLTEQKEEADIILFNTCAVREHAEDRVFGNVGALKALKKAKPSLLIILCGCMMEQEHIAEKIYKSFPYVGLVFGTHVIHRFPELLFQAVTTGKRRMERGTDDGLIHEGLPIHRDGTFKGWLPIMYGCDNFCTYCIVPYVRGRERSRQPSVILEEAKQMIDSGYQEITLLGQNVNSYGKGLKEVIRFPQLLQQVAQLNRNCWISFMTSHPKDASRELIDVMAENPNISRHLHLPFQSGSDRILKKMNRHYDVKRYLEIVAYVKERIPDVELTSDVIVGFPGETEEDFEQTLDLMKQVQFTSLFTFIYSPRVGTPAAKMEDPYTHEQKAQRMTRLLALQESISAKRTAAMLGKHLRVLVEEQAADGWLNARTQGGVVVEVKGDVSLIGTFQTAKITEARHFILRGELLNA